MAPEMMTGLVVLVVVLGVWQERHEFARLWRELWSGEPVEALPHIDDIDDIEEERRSLAALMAYLRSRELQRPALSAQRGVEARIGQLLGPAKPGPKQSSPVREVSESIPKNDRSDFRVLAKALDGKVEIAPGPGCCRRPAPTGRTHRWRTLPGGEETVQKRVLCRLARHLRGT